MGEPIETTTAGLVRAAIDPRDVGASSFLLAYTGAFESVAALFAGNPTATSDWRDAITRVSGLPRDRAAIDGIIAAQQTRRGAPDAARNARARLADPRAVTITTGQQAGAFGGPLYTLLKAVTAIQLARKIEAAHGVPVVPIFWADGEDHDWQEIRATTTFRDGALTDVALPALDGAGERRSGDLLLDARVHDTLDALFAALEPTPHSAGLRRILAECYAPGRSVAEAYARFIEHLLGHQGLVVFESADAAAKPLARDLFAAELRAPGRSSQLAAEAGERARALGFPPQVTPVEGSAALFHLTPAREAVRVPFDGTALAREALERPDMFSPNVLLRPIVQDAMFPNIAYVAGPGELAYHGQLGPIYDAFGVPRPLVCPRASVTILDAPAVRFLDRQALPFAELARPGEAALNALLAARVPPDIAAVMQATSEAVRSRWEHLIAEMPRLDPTLEGAARASLACVERELETLQWKIARAAKRRDHTLRRQFHYAQTLAFPRQAPQERVLGIVYFVNQYGAALIDALVAHLPVDPARHWVVSP